jgi:hypothetical protein
MTIAKYLRRFHSKELFLFEYAKGSRMGKRKEIYNDILD